MWHFAVKTLKQRLKKSHRLKTKNMFGRAKWIRWLIALKNHEQQSAFAPNKYTYIHTLHYITLQSDVSSWPQSMPDTQLHASHSVFSGDVQLARPWVWPRKLKKGWVKSKPLLGWALFNFYKEKRRTHRTLPWKEMSQEQQDSLCPEI